MSIIALLISTCKCKSTVVKLKVPDVIYLCRGNIEICNQLLC